jgi:uncharacterized membrane protein YfcA
MHRSPVALAALIGIVAGTAGGLFGVGGGIIIVPGLVLVLGLVPHRAHPTSGAAVVLIAATALSRFATDGSVDWPAAAALFAGAGLGAILGTRVIDRISPIWLSRAFVAVLLVSAARLLLPQAEADTFTTSVDVAIGALGGLLAAGMVAGLLAGILGVGGGIVFVPALAAFYSVDQHVAQGTSLAAMVPTTILAAALHGRAGRIDWTAAAAAGIGGAVGGWLGAGLALDLDPLLLRRLFAGLLIVVVVRLVGGAKKSLTPGGDI